MQEKGKGYQSTTTDSDKGESRISNRNTLFATASETLGSGMASSIDRVKDFDATKQAAWLKFSSETMEKLGLLLPDFPQKKPQVRADIRCPDEVFNTAVGCAYAFLASQRRQVGKDLKQGPLRHQFGLFNKAGFASTDDFNLNKDLPHQKDRIYEQVFALLSQSSPFIEITKKTNKDAESSFIFTITIKRNTDEYKELHSKNVVSELPFIEDENVLTITLHDYGKNDERTAIVIDHSPTPFAKNYTSRSSYFQVQFELIDPHFQACLNWEPAQGLNEFLVNAGKIAHSLARLQPVGRGNSAIVEWMIRGLAQAKHIELGPFNAR